MKKYFYKPGDTILIKAAVVNSDKKSPYLYKVEITHRTLCGYAVVDGDNLKYFVQYKYVVTKE